MRNVRPQEKKPFFLIRLKKRFGQATKYIISKCKNKLNCDGHFKVCVWLSFFSAPPCLTNSIVRQNACNIDAGVA